MRVRASMPARISPGTAHEHCKAERTSTEGVTMWLSSSVEPSDGVDVERLTRRPVRAYASAKVRSPTGVVQ